MRRLQPSPRNGHGRITALLGGLLAAAGLALLGLAAAAERRNLADALDGLARSARTPSWEGVAPQGELLAGSLGYLRVGSAGGGARAGADRWATSLNDVIQAVGAGDPCGWIVDLRATAEGSFWPMLAGLGPLIGEGPIGGGVDDEGRRSTWSYTRGTVLDGGRSRAQVLSVVYRAPSRAPPVAVLMNRTTGRSGEAVVIAFLGRSDVRTFGERTRGPTRADASFDLRDSAVSMIAVTHFADRLGRTYPSGIDPDETGVLPGSGPAPQLARDWLHRRPACAAGVS